MLGRLEMSVDECIEAYIKLSSQVFNRKHHRAFTVSGKIQARFDTQALEEAVKKILIDRGLSPDELLYTKSEMGCKV